MKEDALWYEAASVVGMTNALNVVADGLPADILPPPDAPRRPRGHPHLLW
jgi:hypothetical protein